MSALNVSRGFHDWAQDNGGGQHSGVCVWRVFYVLEGWKEDLVLFVQDNTQQQHTEMLAGAIDSTDGRISEIPQRYKHISSPKHREKPVCAWKTNRGDEKIENTCLEPF